MCYYNGVKVIRSEFIRLKSIEKAISKYLFLNKPLQVGFDYQNIPVLKKSIDIQDFEIVEMEWGFLPAYIKTREQANKFRLGYTKADGSWQQPILTLNAMSEEMLFKNKMYRESALHRRCLILSTGFYEWRHVFPVSKKTGKPLKTATKYPYRIDLKDQEYFFIAGIYTPWKDESTGEYVETCSIVTTTANEMMEQIHNTKKRMPTILTEDLAWEWLFDDLNEERITEIARYQLPGNAMQAETIAKDFRESIDPVAPFQYNDLPMLKEF